MSSSSPISKIRTIDPYKIENLAFKGGSVKGVAYVGALAALEQIYAQKSLNFRAQLKKVSGTSAGAITALLIALNCTLEEITDYVVNTDLKTFLNKDDSRVNPNTLFTIEEQGPSIAAGAMLGGALLDIHNKFGLYSGNQFVEWLENIVKLKTGIEYCTFAELHQLIVNDNKNNVYGFKDLYVIGFNLSCNITKVFNYETTPNTIISDAVRISMSIPIVFLPHQNYCKMPPSPTKGTADTTAAESDADSGVGAEGGGDDKDKGKTKKRAKTATAAVTATTERVRKPVVDDLWVDGGLTDNYPVRVFDNKNFNERTLGFYFVSPEELAGFEDHGKELHQSIGVRREIKNGFDYVRALFESVIDAQQITTHLSSRDPERTVYINHLNISGLNFALTMEEKQSLINSGWESVFKKFGLVETATACPVELLKKEKESPTEAEKKENRCKIV